MSHIIIIPEDAQLLFLAYLDIRDLANIMLVNKYLENLTKKDDVWLIQLNQQFTTINLSSSFFNSFSAKNKFKHCLQIKNEQQSISKQISTLEAADQLEIYEENKRENFPHAGNPVYATGVLDPTLIVTSFRAIFNFFESRQRQKQLAKLHTNLAKCKLDNSNVLKMGVTGSHR